jgi:hypothetical protein
MKPNFATLMKEMRIVLHPMFKAMSVKDGTNLGPTLDDLEKKKTEMLLQADWTDEEFNKAGDEYYMDFSSENPDNWIIRHDPANATIITPSTALASKSACQN